MDDATAGQSGSGRRVRVGCLLIVLGGLLFIAAMLASAADAPREDVRATGIAALALLVPALAYLIWLGMAMRRRAARGLDRLAFAPEAPLDVPTLRRIESSRLPALARWDRFPSGIRASRRIDNGSTPVSFAVNLPSLRKGRYDPIEPASCYVWFPIPISLPRLILRPDSRDGALLGADVDVENEEFNRRFRVDAAMPLQGGGDDYASFSRYAHAMLHPGAVETLLRLPTGVHVAVDGPIGFAIDRVDSDPERIARIAEVLTGFVAAVPTHVLRRWGEQTGYRPRD